MRKDSIVVAQQERQRELAMRVNFVNELCRQNGAKNVLYVSIHVEAMQTTVIETADSVPAHHKPSDSLFFYSDQWADLTLDLKDSTFYYNIRESLSTIVYREYRYHFLWWKWGTKGYRLKIVNFNPNARVKYNRYSTFASCRS